MDIRDPGRCVLAAGRFIFGISNRDARIV